jgi:hypothetical protein
VASDTSDNGFGSLSESTLNEDIDSQPAFYEGELRRSSPVMPAVHPFYGSPGSQSNYSDTAGSMENEPGSGKSP